MPATAQLAAHFLRGIRLVVRGDLTLAHRHLEKTLAIYDHRLHPRGSLFGVQCRDHQPGMASPVCSGCWVTRSGPRMPAGGAEQRRKTATMHHAGLGPRYGRDGSFPVRPRRCGGPAAGRCAAWLNEAALVFGAWADSLAGREPTEEEPERIGSATDARGHGHFRGCWAPGFGRAAQLLLLAQGYARADKAEAGLAALDEALAWMDQDRRAGARSGSAPAARGAAAGWPVTADGCLGLCPGSEAEACFRRAIAVARRQEARWWELRAAVSLCRLLEERNGPQDASRAEAHQMLAEVYGWFSEGFDTPDLREARALLAEVSQGQWAAAGS